MANGISITKNEYSVLIEKMERLEKAVSFLAAKLEDLFEKEPKYGTEAWWKWSIKKSEEAYKKGKFVSFEEAGELQKYLDHLK